MESEGKYEGEIVANRWNGPGRLDSSAGVYIGEFVNGKYEGEGTFYPPKDKGGGRFVGFWVDGVMVEGNYFFDDDLKHQSKDWAYCSQQDPRFAAEIKANVPREGPLTLETAAVDADGQPPRLPAECYDSIDGYLDPKSYMILDYIDHKDKRRPGQEEREWLIANARVGEAADEEQQQQQQ